MHIVADPCEGRPPTLLPRVQSGAEAEAVRSCAAERAVRRLANRCRSIANWRDHNHASRTPLSAGTWRSLVTQPCRCGRYRPGTRARCPTAMSVAVAPADRHEVYRSETLGPAVHERAS